MRGRAHTAVHVCTHTQLRPVCSRLLPPMQMTVSPCGKSTLLSTTAWDFENQYDSFHDWDFWEELPASIPFHHIRSPLAVYAEPIAKWLPWASRGRRPAIRAPAACPVPSPAQRLAHGRHSVNGWKNELIFKNKVIKYLLSISLKSIKHGLLA